MLIPKLRFPEFRNAGEWKPLPIGEKVDLLSGYPFEGAHISDDPSGVRLLRGINITEGVVRHSSEIDKYYLGLMNKLEKYRVQVNDLVIAMDGSKVGKNVALITPSDNGALLVQRVARLRSECSITIQFIFQLINSIRFQSYVDRINTSSGIPHISAKQINDYLIDFPGINEQKKIADCLSSIDGLIAAETKKIESLKAHKKGLMQQLFPAEGEVVPKLRFPEFQDAGAWMETSLGGLSEIVRGGSPRPIDEFITSDPAGLNWLKIADVDKNSKYVTHTKEKVLAAALKKTREVNPGDLIMSNSMSFGRPYILKIKSCIHDGWIAVTNINKNVSRDFLYYLILSPLSQLYFLNNAAGSGVLNLNADIIKLLPVVIPKYLEQQKIANCLSSLDEIIDAKTLKLESLKAHKKGLIQKLFPASDEVNA